MDRAHTSAQDTAGLYHIMQQHSTSVLTSHADAWIEKLIMNCNCLQELDKMRAACKLGAEVREFAGTLVKVQTQLGRERI